VITILLEIKKIHMHVKHKNYIHYALFL